MKIFFYALTLKFIKIGSEKPIFESIFVMLKCQKLLSLLVSLKNYRLLLCLHRHRIQLLHLNQLHQIASKNEVVSLNIQPQLLYTTISDDPAYAVSEFNKELRPIRPILKDYKSNKKGFKFNSNGIQIIHG